MSPSNHTYGLTCHLARTAPLFGSKSDDDVPPIKAQFFYSSPLPIDDPLTAIPTPSGSESRPTKHSPRPFSAYDNNALEEAWLSLASDRDRKHHGKLRNNPLKLFTKAQADKRASVVSELPTKHNKKHGMNDHNQKQAKEEGMKAGAAKCSKCRKPPDTCTFQHTKTGCAACPAALATAATPTGSSVTGSKGPSSTTSGFAAAATVNADASTKAETEHKTRRKAEDQNDPYDPQGEDPHQPDSSVPVCCSALEKDVKAELRKGFAGILKKRESNAERDQLVEDVMAGSKKEKDGNSIKVKELKKESKKEPKKASKKPCIGPAQGEPADDASQQAKDKSAASTRTVEKDLEDPVLKERHSKEYKAFEKRKQIKDNQQYEKHPEADRTVPSTDPSGTDSHANLLTVPGSSEAGTTGFPFQRALSRNGSPQPRSCSVSLSAPDEDGNVSSVDVHFGINPDGSERRQADVTETIHTNGCKAHKNTHDYANVPVGISRLHLVKLPALQMMPIYWPPVYDIAAVTRGTWFYKDTMYPVEPAVANQLEIGYRELRPWSQTWKDELASAIEVGAAGEEKISHRIWPKESDQKVDGEDASEQTMLAADPFCAARCFHGEVAAVGTVDPGRPDERTSATTEIMKRFPNCHVIYKDLQNAFILKPSLQPSEYYGRKPLAKICKGITVGIHVVRGFDWKTWEKLHLSKKSSTILKADEAAPVAGNADAAKGTACTACRDQEERPKVTDLIFVIHGIGQKLSERVESFRFTHSISAFRRSVNVELGNDAVRNVLRKDLGGIMVLPVNWRSNLSFEDGGTMRGDNESKFNAPSDFTLKDITPDTIPAVRNLISDVMLDIPFYMSHHKPKMIEALVAEANRVYRLWCQNNPDFHGEGRVHIIAHSLGSAMALDVLSKQPTSMYHIDLHSKKISTKYFEFDTKNLFFAGSPAGFFLLLEKSKLMPRRARNKPGAEQSDDNGKDITGEAGTFGCLAVDNLYNVMHYHDPIAYRLNAAVDLLYASTLKNAQVPSATTGWLEVIGNAMRSITPGVSTATDLGVGQIAKPPSARLPSQLEMEVHDFTREEIAEKKFYLLNDNGQIDYFLSSGGGPLEIQYLNMLSAHSSYWSSPDFVRMLVTEVGRKPGKSNTLPSMKVVKASHKK